MNGAVVGGGGHGSAAMVGTSAFSGFELPKTTATAKLDAKADSAERRPSAPNAPNAERTEELNEGDILLAMPADPDVPFELLVPAKVHARAAELAAKMRPSSPPERRAEQATTRKRTPAKTTKRMRSRLAGAVMGIAAAGAALGIAAAASHYAKTPIPAQMRTPSKAARPAPKVFAHGTSARVLSFVPTVHVDSLPKAPL